jgi:hypothetical protein
MVATVGSLRAETSGRIRSGKRSTESTGTGQAMEAAGGRRQKRETTELEMRINTHDGNQWTVR